MTSFEIAINCITAIGALATAGAFIFVVIGQRGTKKQINSLSQMAETLTRHYQMARIQAGNTIYPKIKLSLKHDMMWGADIVVKNKSYQVEIYRMIINTGHHYSDISITPQEYYIVVRQGETKNILPGEISRQTIYTFNTASIRFFLRTPFDEAYEIRYSTDGEKTYQSDPIPIRYCQEDHKSGTELNVTTKSYSIAGNIPGTVEDNFPEIPKVLEDD